MIELEIGPVAHGGYCVARHEGRVVFVRHTLPGERVRARLTEADPAASYWRAEAVEVLDASADRVASPWPEAGPGGVGGGELGHVALPAQRAWKAAVVAEQLRRLGGLDLTPEVEAAPGEHPAGLGWRTRIGLTADAGGRAGMNRHRSHEVVALADMPLAVPATDVAELLGRRWPVGAQITVVAPAADRRLVLVDGVPWTPSGPDRRPTARHSVREEVTVHGRTYRWRVSGTGFWQVHRQAPAVLVEAVLAGVGDVAGGRVLDLFSGGGLFTVPLADAVGESGSVEAVEGDARAVRDARRSLHDRPAVRIHHGDVRRVVPALGEADVVVLDPPRAGARLPVVTVVAEARPRRVVYVACDPAGLARDLRRFGELGYAPVSVRAFDLFPLTHHVECVAVLERVGGSPPGPGGVR